MTPEKRAEIERQIAQIDCFLKSVYAGMAHDIKLVWHYGGGADSIGRKTEQRTADYWRDKYGRHEEITIGASDAYYGSQTVCHMLYDHLYHVRERLQNQLDGTEMSDQYKALAANW